MLRGLVRHLAERFATAPFQRISAISIENRESRYQRSHGHPRSARWDALDRVLIHTTDGGPWDVDVFFVLVLGDETLFIPSDAPGSDALLVALQSLPGFDNAAVIEAMACTDHREFPCWERGQEPC